MSHSKRRVGSRGHSPSKKAQPPVKRPSVGQSRPRTRGSKLSTCIGVTMVMAVISGLALMFIIGHTSSTASASGGGPSVAPGYGSLNHAKGSCGNAGQSPCPAVDPGWFALGTESPTAAAAAIAGSKNFISIAAQYACSLLDTPALVHAYGAHTGLDYYDDDHWVVSVRNGSGMRCGLVDFVYDRAHQRMRFSSYGVLTPQDPHSRLAFPYISSSVAQAKFQSQRKLTVQSGTSLELIFFPIDPSFPYLNSPVHRWAGGGNSAMNPMWLMTGSDSRDYFLGENLQVYAQPDLPIAKGQP